MKNSLWGGAISKLVSTFLCVCLLTSIISFNNNYSYEVKADGNYTTFDLSNSYNKKYDAFANNAARLLSASKIFSENNSCSSNYQYKSNQIASNVPYKTKCSISDNMYVGIGKLGSVTYNLSSSQNFSKIYFIGTSGGYDSPKAATTLSITINYSNGATSSKVVNFYDWNPDNAPTSDITSGVVGISVKQIGNKSSSSFDLYAYDNGSDVGRYLYEYMIPVDKNQTISSITFKSENSDAGSTGTYEVAIFAITGYYSSTDKSEIKAYVKTKSSNGQETSVGYTSLKEAIEAVNNSSGTGNTYTISINEDIDSSSSSNDSNGVTISKEGVTIDTNGHSVNVNVTVDANNVKLTDTSSSKSGSFSNVTINSGKTGTSIEKTKITTMTNNSGSSITVQEGEYTYDPSSLISPAEDKVAYSITNNNGKYTVSKKKQPLEINSEEDLKNALKSALVSSIKLTSNISLNESIDVKGDSSNSSKSIDLNGQTLTTSSSINVGSNTTLTISDGSSGGNGKITSTSSDGAIKVNGGTVNINSGTIENTNNTAIDVSSGTLNINGGTISGSKAINTTSGNISITGGNIKSTGENNADIVTSESSNTTVSIAGGNFGHGFSSEGTTNKSSWLSTSDSTTYSAISSDNSEYPYVVVNVTTINSSVNEYTSTDEDSNHNTVTGDDYETLKTLVEQYEAINSDNSNKDNDYETKLQTLKDKRDAAKWIFESLNGIDTSTNNVSPLTDDQKSKVKEAIKAYKGESEDSGKNLTESQRQYISSDTLSSTTSSGDGNTTVTLTSGVLKDMNDAIIFEDTYSDALKTGDNSKVSFTIDENGAVTITPSNLSEAKNAYEGLSDNAKKYADGGSGSSSSDNDGNTSTTITGSEDYTIITDKLAVAEFLNTQTSDKEGETDTFASLLNKAKNTESISSSDLEAFTKLVEGYDKLTKTNGTDNGKSNYIDEDTKAIIENARKAVEFVESVTKSSSSESSTGSDILADTNSDTKTTVENTTDYKTKLDNANSAYNNAVSGSNSDDGSASTENILAKKLLEDYKKNLDNKNAAYNWYNPTSGSTSGESKTDYKDIFESTKTTVTADDLSKINAAVKAYKNLDDSVKDLIDNSVITYTKTGTGENATYTFSGDLINKQEASSYLKDIEDKLSSYTSTNESTSKTTITTKDYSSDSSKSYKDLSDSLQDAIDKYSGAGDYSSTGTKKNSALSDEAKKYIDGNTKDENNTSTSSKVSELKSQKEAIDFLNTYASVLTKDPNSLTSEDLATLKEAQTKFKGGDNVTGALSDEAKAYLDDTVKSRIGDNSSVTKANEWISSYATEKTTDGIADYTNNILGKTPITDVDLDKINAAITAYNELKSTDHTSTGISYEQALVGGEATISKLLEMKNVATWYSQNKTIIGKKDSPLSTGDGSASDTTSDGALVDKALTYTITENASGDGNSNTSTTISKETIEKYISSDVLTDLDNKNKATDFTSKYKDTYLSEEGIDFSDKDSITNNKKAIEEALEEYNKLSKEAKKYADGASTDENGNVTNSSYLTKLEDKLDTATLLEKYSDVLTKNSTTYTSEDNAKLEELYKELDSKNEDGNAKYSENVKKYVAESILEKTKEDAIKKLKDEAKNSTESINSMDNLLEDETNNTSEKSTYTSQLTESTNTTDESSKTELDKAIEAIKNITLGDKDSNKTWQDLLKEKISGDNGVNKTTEEKVNSIKKVEEKAQTKADKNLQDSKDKANKSLEEKAKEEKNAIDQKVTDGTLTKDQAEEYKKYVDYKLEEAKKDINKSKTISGNNSVTSKKADLESSIGGTTDTNSESYVSPDKITAINTLISTKEEKEEVLDNMAGFGDKSSSNETRDNHKESIDKSISDAINSIKNSNDSSKYQDIIDNTNTILDNKVDNARSDARKGNGNGTVTNTTKPSDNSNKATIVETDSLDLEDKLLSESDKQELDKGTNVDIWVEVKEVSKDASIDLKLDEIKKELGNSQSANLPTYLDIKLYKQVSGKEKEEIAETNKSITISLVVPDEAINTDSNITREYRIIRSHTVNGVTSLDTIIPTSYDSNSHILTFTSDKFSTYALVYIDTKKDTSNTSTNKTEANTPCEEWNKSRNWTWSEKLGRCVYRVRNTGSK